MKQNFTNQDLEQMLGECVSELEALGYEVLPISSIEFTKRKSRNQFGFCKLSKDCYFDYSKWEWAGNMSVYIRITGNLSFAPIKYRNNLKTLVMHETIHAVKAPAGLKNTNSIPDFDTPHGLRYDMIKERVERELGYHNIDDDTGCGLASFLAEYNRGNAK